MNIIDCMEDEEAFAPWFRGSSWDAWKAIMKAAFAVPMAPEELATFHELAGGRSPPKRRVKELVIVASRRCGKDSVSAMIVPYVACIEQPHLGLLRRGEKAHIALIACDKEQANIVSDYTRAFFDDIPDLQAMVTRRTRNGIELNNGVNISIVTNSFRQSRGRTILLAILDECAYYRDENSASPDTELYRALSPSLATIPNSMMCLISSPYMRSGLLYDKWKASFGKDDDRCLVIQAASRQLNPLIDEAEVEARKAEDPDACRSEWLGEWREMLTAYTTLQAIEDAIVAGVTQRKPVRGTSYLAFVDLSGGRNDSMVLCIAHRDRETDQFVVDLIYEQKPEAGQKLSPVVVAKQFAAACKVFKCGVVYGDDYGAEWAQEPFKRLGVNYKPIGVSKSELYVEFLNHLNSERVELLDGCPRMVTQFTQLERRTIRGSNHESIDHPRNLHDDISNAVAGAIYLVANRKHQPLRISDSVLGRAGYAAGGAVYGESGAEYLRRKEAEAKRLASRPWRTNDGNPPAHLEDNLSPRRWSTL